MPDSPQDPPKRRRLRSDPLGLGEETPSRKVGFDPLGLGNPPPVDPLALAKELLAQSEPSPQAPPQPRAPHPTYRPSPRLDPLGLSSQPPPKLSLEKVGDQTQMTRKMTAIEGATDTDRTELTLERVGDRQKPPGDERPELALGQEKPKEERIELHLERVGVPQMTQKMPTVVVPSDKGPELPLERVGDHKLPTSIQTPAPVRSRPTQPASGPALARPPGTPTAPTAPRPESRPRRQPAAQASFLDEQVLRLRALVDRKQRVTTDDLVVFTRQFCAMVSSGLQLHQSLYFYAQNEPDMALSKVVHDVADRIGQGNSLSSSLRRYPNIFSEVYTGLIAAGESTGMLVAVLSKLADLSEKNQRLRKKVWSTLTYPMVLMTVSTTCVLAFLYFVLPMLVPLFTTLGVQLPLPTRMLLQFSALMKNPITLAVVISTPVAAWLLWPFLRSTLGRHPKQLRGLHRIPLELPVIGRVVEKVITARIMFSMATLLDSGHALNATLEKCEKVAGNAEIAWRLREARRMLVDEGATAAECLGRAHVFPNGAIQMIAVGEETAALSEMIGRVAQVYEDDVEMALMDTAAMLEPAILIVMGVIVGFIVLAAVLPTVSLLNKL